jgi:hypothetical protein
MAARQEVFPLRGQAPRRDITVATVGLKFRSGANIEAMRRRDRRRTLPVGRDTARGVHEESEALPRDLGIRVICPPHEAEEVGRRRLPVPLAQPQHRLDGGELRGELVADGVDRLAIDVELPAISWSRSISAGDRVVAAPTR